jgi:hypothetical protein
MRSLPAPARLSLAAAFTAAAHAGGLTPPALAITLTPRSTTAGSTLSIAPTKSRA